MAAPPFTGPVPPATHMTVGVDATESASRTRRGLVPGREVARPWDHPAVTPEQISESAGPAEQPADRSGAQSGRARRRPAAAAGERVRCRTDGAVPGPGAPRPRSGRGRGPPGRDHARLLRREPVRRPGAAGTAGGRSGVPRTGASGPGAPGRRCVHAPAAAGPDRRADHRDVRGRPPVGAQPADLARSPACDGHPSLGEGPSHGGEWLALPDTPRAGRPAGRPGPGGPEGGRRQQPLVRPAPGPRRGTGGPSRAPLPCAHAPVDVRSTRPGRRGGGPAAARPADRPQCQCAAGDRGPAGRTPRPQGAHPRRPAARPGAGRAPRTRRGPRSGGAPRALRASGADRGGTGRDRLRGGAGQVVLPLSGVRPGVGARPGARPRPRAVRTPAPAPHGPLASCISPPTWSRFWLRTPTSAYGSCSARTIRTPRPRCCSAPSWSTPAAAGGI